MRSARSASRDLAIGPRVRIARLRAVHPSSQASDWLICGRKRLKAELSTINTTVAEKSYKYPDPRNISSAINTYDAVWPLVYIYSLGSSLYSRFWPHSDDVCPFWSLPTNNENRFDIFASDKVVLPVFAFVCVCVCRRISPLFLL